MENKLATRLQNLPQKMQERLESLRCSSETAKLLTEIPEPSPMMELVIQKKIQGIPPMSLLKKIEGETEILAAISSLIAEAVLQLNIGKNMTASQIQLAATHIMNNYYFFTIDEVRRMLANGITLKYGPIYDRLDISVISEWCEKFNSERMDAHKRIEAYETGNKNIYDIFQNDTMKKILGDTMAEIDKRNSGKLSRVAEGKKLQQSEFEQFILKSWDNYRKRYGAFVPGRPFKGRFVDFTSFAEHKYEQLERIIQYYESK